MWEKGEREWSEREEEREREEVRERTTKERERGGREREEKGILCEGCSGICCLRCVNTRKRCHLCSGKTRCPVSV